MFAVVSIHQIYVESSFTGLFGAINNVLIASILFLVARIVDWVIQEHSFRKRLQPRPTLRPSP
jgi:hypothetical protein